MTKANKTADYRVSFPDNGAGCEVEGGRPTGNPDSQHPIALGLLDAMPDNGTSPDAMIGKTFEVEGDQFVGGGTYKVVAAGFNEDNQGDWFDVVLAS